MLTHKLNQTKMRGQSKMDMAAWNARVCVCKAKRVCCALKEDRGFPWGDSAVLWAWAAHPVTMDHCPALSKGENMCMLVWVYEYVCFCTCNPILKEWTDERKAVISLGLGAGRGTNKDAPILSRWVETNGELLACLHSVSLNQRQQEKIA